MPLAMGVHPLCPHFEYLKCVSSEVYAVKCVL